MVLCAEEEVRDVIAYWLAPLPIRTVIVADGCEAASFVKEPACELLITDRVLPPWPGLDTFLELRSNNPHLRIAVVDDGTRETRVLARVSGATSVLPRPLTRKSVVEQLGRPEVVL